MARSWRPRMGQFTGLLGVGVMVLLGLCLSYKPRQVRWRLVLVGVLVQVMLAGAILRVPGIKDGFEKLAWFVNQVIQKAQAGINFVFGYGLPDDKGAWGFIF